MPSLSHQPLWRLGVGQTAWEELEEIEAAKRSALVWEYLDAQRWSRLIEAESERRRAAKAGTGR